jgi:hypothetical protein
LRGDAAALPRLGEGERRARSRRIFLRRTVGQLGNDEASAAELDASIHGEQQHEADCLVVIREVGAVRSLAAEPRMVDGRRAAERRMVARRPP